MAPHTLYSLSLLVTLLSTAFASPQPIKLDFTKSVSDPVSDPIPVAKRDGSVEIVLGHNARRVVYQADVSIGTPPQKFTLQVDTGSSDTWVPAASAGVCSNDGCPTGSFSPDDSSTFTQLDTDGSFNISYDSPGDTDAGYYFTDVLALTDSVSIKAMTIGLATTAFDAQGLIGMGYPDNEASESTLGTSTPTVLYQLYQMGLINRPAFSLYMNDLNAKSGSILFGAVDSSKYTGNLMSFPIQTDPVTNKLDEFVVTMTSVSVTDNTGTRLLSSPDLSVAALLDSGTTSLVLPDDIYVAILNGMGGTNIGAGYSPVVPCSYANANVSLTFGFGGDNGLFVTVPISEMIAHFYITDDSTYTNGVEQCNLDVSSQADDLSGSVILGDAFLRAAYVVYDLQNNEIAIAQANLNPGSENIQTIASGTGLPGVTTTAPATAALITGNPEHTGGAVTTVTGGTVAAPATPTFALGAAASAAGGSGSGSGSSGAGQLQAGGIVGMSAGLGLVCLVAALVL